MAMFTTKHIPQNVYMDYIGHPTYVVLALMTSIKTTNGRAKLQHQ